MFFRLGSRRGRRRVGLEFHTDEETGWCSRWGVSGRTGGRCACGVAGVRVRQWAEVLGVVAAAVGAGDAGGVVRRGFDEGAVCEAHFHGGLGLLEQERAAGVFALGAFVGMPESVVADLVKSPGEHVLEETAHELVSGERAGAPLLALAVLVAQSHGVLVDGEDASIGNCDAVDVAGEVIEHGGFALSPGLAPGDPIAAPYVGGQLRFEVGAFFFECVVELAAHELGQGAHGHEKRMLGLSPRSPSFPMPPPETSRCTWGW